MYVSGLRLLDQTGLDRLYADPHAFYLTRWEANLDALNVGTELTLCGLGDVGTDTTALLGLSFAVDD